MLRLLLIVTCLSFASFLSSKEPALPEPYCSLEKILPPNPQGWYANAQQMEELFKDHNIRTVVEVGSWLGKSTCHIASQLGHGGRVYAIDHWLGSVEHQDYENLPTLYDQFLSNVIHAGLTHRIIPLRMDSLQGAGYLKHVPVDLVYLDAAHDKESVLKDLEAWFPYVKGHGVLCGDDWGWKSVEEAVREFAQKNRLKIVYGKNFWRLVERP